MTAALTQHILLGIVAIVVFAVLWRLLRVFVYIAIGLAIVTRLSSLLHGQVPPWIAAAVPWLEQLARRAGGTLLQPTLRL
ncbi:MAG TPA: hypothetical protein VGZ23_19385 [bacterium]|nr:hypothetical protein [bacterium]